MVSVRVSGSLFTGNRVTVTCSVEISASILSTVRPVVIWRRGTIQLFNNSRTNVSELVSTGSTSLFESNLTINSIVAADSGNYICEASLVLMATNNVVATNSSLVYIVVEGEPDIFSGFPFLNTFCDCKPLIKNNWDPREQGQDEHNDIYRYIL